MANQTTKPKRTHSSEPVHAQKKRRRRGPLLRFRFSAVILIWIFCVIGGFGIYMVQRNIHPEIAAAELAAKNKSDKDTDSDTDTTDWDVDDTDADDFTADDAAVTDVTTPPAEGGETAPIDTSASQVVIQAKINPVPEGAPKEGDYVNHCAFLGDSNIWKMGQNGLLQTMSVYSDETLNLGNYETHYFDLNGTQIKMLSAIRAADCPIYLLFGAESLKTMTPEKASDLYLEMLNKVQAAAPESKIYVLAVPPVTQAAEKAEKQLLNSTIDKFNSLLLTIANDSNVYFVDTNTALKNNDSRLDKDKAEEDGIHLNAEGERILLDYVLCHVPE